MQNAERDELQESEKSARWHWMNCRVRVERIKVAVSPSARATWVAGVTNSISTSDWNTLSIR